MKIILNKDIKLVERIKNRLEETDGHCPCVLPEYRNSTTKCPCSDFLYQAHTGLCKCGLYNKVEVQEEKYNK